MSRIYRTPENIDGRQVKDFFNARARREQNAVNAVMLQSAGSTLAQERDDYEKSNLVPQLAGPSKVLELGCGAGRLARVYDNGSNRYLGLDFSEELIERANDEASSRERILFQVAEVPNIRPEELKLQPPFDLLIVTALILYLNDDAVHETFALIARLAAPRATVYVRESLSEMDVRLTLKGHFSEELGEEYNAIYRTPAELKAVIDETLGAAGFSYDVCADYAFPPSLRNRAETAQRYFTLSRK